MRANSYQARSSVFHVCFKLVYTREVPRDTNISTNASGTARLGMISIFAVLIAIRNNSETCIFPLLKNTSLQLNVSYHMILRCIYM